MPCIIVIENGDEGTRRALDPRIGRVLHPTALGIVDHFQAVAVGLAPCLEECVEGVGIAAIIDDYMDPVAVLLGEDGVDSPAQEREAVLCPCDDGDFRGHSGKRGARSPSSRGVAAENAQLEQALTDLAAYPGVCRGVTDL